MTEKLKVLVELAQEFEKLEKVFLVGQADLIAFCKKVHEKFMVNGWDDQADKYVALNNTREILHTTIYNEIVNPE